MSNEIERYSEHDPLQALGEAFSELGDAGPAKPSRWPIAAASLLATAAIAVSPAGAAIVDAIDDLVGSEPTAPSLFFGDAPGDRELSVAQQAVFEQLLETSVIAGVGTTPAGTPFQAVVTEEAGSPVFGSCAFVAFDIDSDSSRDTQTCIGPTVQAGFAKAQVPLYPTVYRGPVESGEIPTPVIIGVAPAEVASVRISHPSAGGQRVEAPTTTVPVTASLLGQSGSVEAEGGPLRDVREPLQERGRRPSFANDPYSFFVGFLPPELDQHGPNARQVEIDYQQIRIAALDADGNELYSMRMDGRFSGDPGLLSFG